MKVFRNQSDHLVGGCCTCRAAVAVVVSPVPHRFRYFVFLAAFHSVSECFRSCAQDVVLHCSSVAVLAEVLPVGAAEDVAWSGSDASSSCDWDWRS